MALYPKGKGSIYSSAAATNQVKTGAGTLVFLSALGGTGGRIDLYDAADVSEAVPANAIGSIHVLSATVAYASNPFLLFERGLVMVPSGTFTGAFISVAVE